MNVVRKVASLVDRIGPVSEQDLNGMKLRLSIALLFALLPTLALAKPHTTSTHLRPQLFHDRTPKVHVHSAKPHINA